MVDITQKSSTLRKAIAQATVTVSKQETIDALVNDKVPKGNVFEMAKTAGLFAVKKTSDIIGSFAFKPNKIYSCILRH